MGSSCSRHGAQGPGERAEKPYSRGLKTVKGTQAEQAWGDTAHLAMGKGWAGQ